MLQNVELPRYGRRDLNCVWYHQLHGHVPGAQQEKMLEPEPDEEIQASPHINTAWRYLSTLAPRTDESFGLTFANLSTQPQPGRGGIAVMLAIRTLRGSGTVDHGGREGALIRHALIAVNRGLGQATLAAAAESLIRHSIGLSNLRLTATEERRDGPVDEWYHKYRQSKDWNTAERKQYLLKYLQSFYTLPEIQEPRVDYHYAGSKPLRQLVYIEHDKQLTYFDLIAYASYLASALHLSSIPDCPWAAVQVGTQFTEPDQGLTIRFVTENTLRDEPGHRIHFRELPLLSARDGRQRLHELMSELFGLSVEPLTEPRLLRASTPPKSLGSDIPTVEVQAPTLLPVAALAETIAADTRLLTMPPAQPPCDPGATVLGDSQETVALEAGMKLQVFRRTPSRSSLPALHVTRPLPIINEEEGSRGYDRTAPEVRSWEPGDAEVPPAAPRHAKSRLRLLGIGLAGAGVCLLLILAALQVQKFDTNHAELLKELRACSSRTVPSCPPAANLPVSVLGRGGGSPPTSTSSGPAAAMVGTLPGAAKAVAKPEVFRTQGPRPEKQTPEQKKSDDPRKDAQLGLKPGTNPFVIDDLSGTHAAGRP